MGYRLISHTADTGVEATAPTLDRLIAELARGMFASMARARGPRRRRVRGAVEAETVEDLVVDTLSQLLWVAETEGLVLDDIRIEVGPDRVRLEFDAGGVSLDQAEVEGPPIKAVTYHDLAIERRGGEWYGRVYFDV